MEKYFCNCLNVVVNVNSKETREAEGKDFIQSASSGLLDEVENIDPFFADKLLDIKLGISGVEVSQAILSTERCCGDWLVTTCLNCGIDTHALHVTKQADRVLLSANILSGEAELNNIKLATTYSAIFQIDLVEASKRIKNNVACFTPSNVLRASEKLNTVCKKLIQAGEEGKNERIRVLTENENQQFRDYKIKANRDKECLLKAIRDVDHSSTIFDSLLNESHLDPSADDHRMLESRDVHMALPNISAKVQSMAIPSNKKREDIPRGGSDHFGMSQSMPITEHSRDDHHHETLSASIKKHNRNTQSSLAAQQRKIEHNDNDDILFDMEGYHNEKNCEPFFESDDESSGDATSLEGSGGYTTLIPSVGAYTPSLGIKLSSSVSNRGDGKSADRSFARSLPVAVPTFFNNVRTSYDTESDEEPPSKEESKESPCFSKLAASFKAVAKSMQDSTGMFGDLPPHRHEYPQHSVPNRNPLIEEGVAYDSRYPQQQQQGRTNQDSRMRASTYVPTTSWRL